MTTENRLFCRRVLLTLAVLGTWSARRATSAEESQNPTTAGAAVVRVAVPLKPALAAAEKVIGDLYKPDFDQALRGGADVKTALAKKLFEQGQKIADDAAARYVFYTRSKDLAVSSGDVADAMAAIDMLADNYTIDRPAEKFTTLTAIAKNLHKPDELQSALAAANDAIEQAIAVDEYETATKLARFATGMAAKVHDNQAASTLKNKMMDIDILKKEFNKIVDAKKKLMSTPDDPEANAAVGFYEGALKGDFQTALPLMAKGKPDSLKDLATKELATPKTAEDQAKLADGWWLEADRQGNPAKNHLRTHAIEWYQRALPELKGLAKIQADARLKQFEAERPGSVAPIRASIVKVLTNGDWHIVWYVSKTDPTGPIAKEYKRFHFNADGTLANIAGETKTLGKWQFVENGTKIIATYDNNESIVRFEFELVGDTLRCANYNPPTSLLNVGLAKKASQN